RARRRDLARGGGFFGSVRRGWQPEPIQLENFTDAGVEDEAQVLAAGRRHLHEVFRGHLRPLIAPARWWYGDGSRDVLPADLQVEAGAGGPTHPGGQAPVRGVRLERNHAERQPLARVRVADVLAGTGRCVAEDVRALGIPRTVAGVDGLEIVERRLRRAVAEELGFDMLRGSRRAAVIVQGDLRRSIHP